MTDIKSQKLEQLKKYAAWEKQEYPDSTERQHMLDWAVLEIERLRSELTQIGMREKERIGMNIKLVTREEAMSAYMPGFPGSVHNPATIPDALIQVTGVVIRLEVNMKARMKDNLIVRYQLCAEFNYKDKSRISCAPNELIAVREVCGWQSYFETKKFLKSIEGKIVDLVFTGADAFEKEDNNYWLPDSLWKAV